MLMPASIEPNLPHQKTLLLANPISPALRAHLVAMMLRAGSLLTQLVPLLSVLNVYSVPSISGPTVSL